MVAIKTSWYTFSMKPFTLVLTSKKARQLQVIPKGTVMLKFIHHSWWPTNGKLNFYFKLWKYLSLISYSFKYFPRRFLEFLSSWTWNLHQIDNNILAQITMWRLWRDVWCDVWIHYNHSYWTLRKLNKSAITNQLIDTWNNFEILLQPWKKKKYFIFFALFNLSKKFSNVPNLNWAQ